MVFRCATLSSWLFYGKVATWQPQNFLNVRLRCQQRSIEICGDGNPAIKGSEKIPGTRMESFQSELRIFFLKSLDNLCWSGWPIDRFLEGEWESVWERVREREREGEKGFLRMNVFRCWEWHRPLTTRKILSVDIGGKFNEAVPLLRNSYENRNEARPGKLCLNRIL